MSKNRTSNEKYFSLLIWVLMLQSLRNINMAIYTIVLLITYVMLYIKYPVRNLILDKRITLWLILYLFMPIISLIFGISMVEFITAITRYLALVPLVFWGITHLEMFYNQTSKILRIFVLVTVLSALLMVYQLIFGRIELFLEVTERVGYSRYSSLLGSPTTYGGLAPLAYLALSNWNLFNRKWILVFQLFIVIGGILSLSKAFYVNFALCIALSIIFKSRSHNRISARMFIKLISGLVGMLVVVITFWSIVSNTIIGDYFNKMIYYTFKDQYNSVNVDLFTRLTELPRQAFQFHNLESIQYIFGIGFKGYSGVLGLPDYPMCHNDYFSLVLAQGVVFLIAMLLLYFSIILKCFRNKSVHAVFSMNVVFYILVNMFAGQWNYLTTFNMLFFMIIISNLKYSRRLVYEKSIHNYRLSIEGQKEY